MRIAIVYDCLFPHTVGGAERWYRDLAERLTERHEVTYLTRRQWPAGEDPSGRFRVVAVSGGGGLYTRSGRRRIWPAVRFGLGVFRHLLRSGGSYDVVHSASFPYFSLLGAWLALRLRGGAPLVVDWHELWSRSYWISYLGRLGGRAGHAVQRLCTRLPDQSFVFSRLHAERLTAERPGAPLVRLTGEYAEDPGGASDGEGARDPAAERPPLVVFAGRHVPEKRVALVPDVIAAARRSLPGLRCIVLGDGPDRQRVAERAAELGLGEALEVRGAVPAGEVRRTIAGAACLLLPSLREGYGLVVVEALARATPALVVAGPENAAVELIEPGVNGLVAPAPDPEPIAELLVEIVERGAPLRRSALEWYRAHAAELSIESSLAAIESAYRSLSARS